MCEQRFKGAVNSALDELQEDRGLAGWPDAEPRFMLDDVRIDFQAPILWYSFTAIVSIVSPVNDDLLQRVHVRHVSDVFAIETLSMDEDNMQVISPYMVACANVLSYRVGRVLSERFG